jgi:hypothetical protein
MILPGGFPGLCGGPGARLAILFLGCCHDDRSRSPFVRVRCVGAQAAFGGVASSGWYLSGVPPFEGRRYAESTWRRYRCRLPRLHRGQSYARDNGLGGAVRAGSGFAGEGPLAALGCPFGISAIGSRKGGTAIRPMRGGDGWPFRFKLLGSGSLDGPAGGDRGQLGSAGGGFSGLGSPK